MTSGNLPKLADDPRRRWACDQLDWPADVSLDEARRRWLERLAADGFVPSEESAQAFALIHVAEHAGLSPDDPPALVLKREYETLEAVDAFADDFFQTPPTDRRARFIELRRKSARVHRAKARLDALEPALDVKLPVAESAGEDEPTVESLAMHLGRLFVLSPVRRAGAQRRLLGVFGNNGDAWELVARRLQHDHPDVARLMPELVSYLAAWRRHRRLESRRVRRRRRKQRASANSGAEPREGLAWFWFLALGLGIPVAIVMAYLDDHDRPPPSAPPSIIDLDELDGTIRLPDGPSEFEIRVEGGKMVISRPEDDEGENDERSRKDDAKSLDASPSSNLPPHPPAAR